MRILCAVDGSECSKWGVQALETFAGREVEHIALVHVIDRQVLRAARGRNPVAERRALAAMQKAGEQLLREAEGAAKAALGQAATAPGTEFHRLLVQGPLAVSIAQQARRWKADLLVIGSRGLSDIKGFLLGSVSRRVAAMTPCALLVVKQPPVPLRRVTLAVDDSKPSRAAAAFLRTRVLPDFAAVTILSSAENPVTDLAARYLSESQLAALTKPVTDRATAMVNDLRDDFIKDGFSVTTQVELGHVVDTIVKQVETSDADLLVIGSRVLTKSERLHLGSVSESLLRHAPCSVLTVRGTRA